MAPGRLLAVFCAAAVSLGTLAQDENPEATRRELEALRARISAISAAMRAAEAERGRIRRELRKTEATLAAVAGRMERVRGEIDETERQRERLLAQERDIEKALEAQRKAIHGAIQNAWQLGAAPPLKLLLNLEDPATVARQFAYLRYLIADRQDTVAEYRSTLERLAGTRSALDDSAERLARQKAELDRERAERVRERAQRASLIAALDEELEEQGSTLEALERDRETLEELLGQLEEAVAAAPRRPPAQPFSEARGAMPWPVDGARPGNRFGRARNRGKMRWQGVNLLAEAGTTVRAIHDGRVVYADWLRGSGLLLVLDHGEDYLSLYAHNGTLLREVGEWVSAGAPIATVGDSGGQPQPALYFEIRKGGQPVDPALWCRG